MLKEKPGVNGHVSSARIAQMASSTPAKETAKSKESSILQKIIQARVYLLFGALAIVSAVAAADCAINELRRVEDNLSRSVPRSVPYNPADPSHPLSPSFSPRRS